MPDMVNHPPHYTNEKIRCIKCDTPVECIQVTEEYDFVIGNIIKYAWRAGSKEGTSALQDLEKCAWYANRAVEREKKRSTKEF